MSARSRRVVLAVSAAAALALIGTAAWTLTSNPQPALITPGPVSVGPHNGLPTKLAALTPDGPQAADDTEAAEELPALIADQLLVGVRPGEDLGGVAAAFGVRVAQEVGPSGFGALLLAEGDDMDALIAALADDGRVVHAGPMGAIYAAGKKKKKKSAPPPEDDAADTSSSTDSSDDAARSSSSSTSDPEPPAPPDLTGFQWHLAAVDLPDTAPRGLADIVVAVLDSGVAYKAEKGSDGTTSAVAASLAGSEIVAPYDFVNDDEIANDDNQHGTHIASLIASNGAVMGVAPGVSLMPLKVLDQNRQGNELDLLDALAHATSNGADVINMSLAFSDSYVPSGPLQTALADAADAGAVLVAATGNSGLDTVAWPAASPAAIAVASSASSGESMAWYSNASPHVDIVAPGGNLDVDWSGDGLPDGTLAEAIPYQDASRTGYFFGEGTSQAAALVSGLAARLLAAGSDPADVPMLIRVTGSTLGSVGDGYGGGLADVRNAEQTAPWMPGIGTKEAVHVAMLPYLGGQDRGGVRPHAMLTALGASGEPLRFADLWVRFDGPAVEHTTCRTDWHGTCQVSGPTTSEKKAAFTVTVEAASVMGKPLATPTAALFASDALEVLIAAMKANPETADALPAFYLPAGEDPFLGEVSEHYMAVNSGTGLLSSPMGIVWSPKAMSVQVTRTTTTFDLDGTGLMSSPMGFQPAYVLSFSGMGLMSSPMGFRLATLNGTGLMSSPMGFSAEAMYVADAAPTVPVKTSTFSSNVVMLASSTIDSVDATGTELDAVLADGGWVSATGGGAASMVLSASTSTSPAPMAGSGLLAPMELAD